MAEKLKATLIRSPIGKHRTHKETVVRLGFKRLHHTIVKENRPEILGMLNKIRYMVKVELVPEEAEDA
ncbi:50S ribosomal protein L30 [bacterium]|nr:50S ribosomal protein L30 [bacterium]